MFGLKRLFGRDRPENQLLEEATNFSFPSGHALMSVTFYGLIAYELWQRIKNPFLRWAMILVVIVWILLIGYSRIYLRRHYYSDVIAGYCIGFLWLVFAIWMLNRMEKYSRRKINPIVEEKPVPKNRMRLQGISRSLLNIHPVFSCCSVSSRVSRRINVIVPYPSCGIPIIYNSTFATIVAGL